MDDQFSELGDDKSERRLTILLRADALLLVSANWSLGLYQGGISCQSLGAEIRRTLILPQALVRSCTRACPAASNASCPPASSADLPLSLLSSPARGSNTLHGRRTRTVSERASKSFRSQRDGPVPATTLHTHVIRRGLAPFQELGDGTVIRRRDEL